VLIASLLIAGGCNHQSTDREDAKDFIERAKPRLVVGL